MDELPELQSDADVDTLMARLRSKLAPASPAPLPVSESSAASVEHTLRDSLAVQQELASTMVRAMQVMADTLDDLQAEAEPPAPPTVRARDERSAVRKAVASVPAEARARGARDSQMRASGSRRKSSRRKVR